MPHLIKCDKWVFGWCIVNDDMQILIPPLAYEEYEFQEGETALFIKGSKKSGGFGVARQPVVSAMPFFARIFYQGGIGENGIIHMPEMLECKPTDKLLVVRNSKTVLGFIQFGPVVEEAKNHNEIETFRVEK